MDALQNSTFSPARPRADAAQSTTSKISSDFQTFLKMLTTQMQNQNPLEPIEASDFAVQLATFSNVEQQVRTNELLSQMIARSGISELGAWIGKSALTAQPVFISSGETRLIPPEVEGADRAELVVRTIDGLELARFPVNAAATEIIFDNSDLSERPLPEGHYKMSVESFRGSTSLGENPALGYARIEEARIDAGQVLLVLQGGHIIGSSDVIGLRE